MSHTDADHDAAASVVAHHRQLSADLDSHVSQLQAAARTSGTDWEAHRDGLVAWLKTELLPHAAAEENALYPAAAAQLLAEEFRDHRSWSGYRALCDRAWRGELSPELLADAYRQATGPKARNRGAVLFYAVKRGQVGPGGGCAEFEPPPSPVVRVDAEPDR